MKLFRRSAGATRKPSPQKDNTEQAVAAPEAKTTRSESPNAEGRMRPLIGRMSSKTKIRCALLLALVAAVVAAWLLQLGVAHRLQAESGGNSGRAVEMLSQRLLVDARDAANGSADALKRLDGLRRSIDESANAAKTAAVLLSEPGRTKARLLHGILSERLAPRLQDFVKQGPALAGFNEQAAKGREAAKELYRISDQLVAVMTSSASPQVYLTSAEHVRSISARMQHTDPARLTSIEDATPLAEYINDFRSLKQTLEVLTRGDSALGIPAISTTQIVELLRATSGHVEVLDGAVTFFERSGPHIFAAHRILIDLDSAAKDSARHGAELAALTRQGAEATNLVFYGAAGLGLLAIALLGLSVTVFVRRPSAQGASAVPSAHHSSGLVAGNGAPHESSLAVSQVVDDIVHMQMQSRKRTSDLAEAMQRVSSLIRGLSTATGRTTEAVRLGQSVCRASDDAAALVEQTKAFMTQSRANMSAITKSMSHLDATSRELGVVMNAFELIASRTRQLAISAGTGANGLEANDIAAEAGRLADQSADALASAKALVQRVQRETSHTLTSVEESAADVIHGANLSDAAATKLAGIGRLATELTETVSGLRSQSAAQEAMAGKVQTSMERLNEVSRGFHVQVEEVVVRMKRLETPVWRGDNRAIDV